MRLLSAATQRKATDAKAAEGKNEHKGAPADTTTENGAGAHSTSGSSCLDLFFGGLVRAPQGELVRRTRFTSHRISSPRCACWRRKDPEAARRKHMSQDQRIAKSKAAKKARIEAAAAGQVCSISPSRAVPAFVALFSSVEW